MLLIQIRLFWSIMTDLTVFEGAIGPSCSSFSSCSQIAEFGKLGMSLEGGGKRRFFALG